MSSIPNDRDLYELPLRAVVCYVVRILKRLEPDFYRLRDQPTRYGVTELLKEAEAFCRGEEVDRGRLAQLAVNQVQFGQQPLSSLVYLAGSAGWGISEGDPTTVARGTIGVSRELDCMQSELRRDFENLQRICGRQKEAKSCAAIDPSESGPLGPLWDKSSSRAVPEKVWNNAAKKRRRSNRMMAARILLSSKAVQLSIGAEKPEEIEDETPAHAADVLEGHVRDLVGLLVESGHKEESLHQWLKDERHHVFLDAHADEVLSKVPFGASVSDFVIRRSDGTYVLVEIEPADKRIFRRDNSEPTAEFNHACQQVRDWQRYIRDNVRTVRDELGLADIYEPKGMVLMGRSGDIEGDKARRRWIDMKNRHEFALFTYDELCERVNALAATLRNSSAP